MSLSHGIKGIDNAIAHHVSEDLERSEMLRHFVELRDKLKRFHGHEVFDHIWASGITPWANREGFDISLRVITGADPARTDKKSFRVVVTEALAEVLSASFKRQGDGEVAEWKPNVRIYVDI